MSWDTAVYHSPIGVIYVAASEKGICRVMFGQVEWKKENENKRESGTSQRGEALCREAVAQLEAYFQGKRRSFTLPLDISGTDFQKKVWRALCTIPYGETRTYADMAAMIGQPRAVRAVGQANRWNPLPIMIPCHRVIGKNGDLRGYAGTRTEIKSFLLHLEEEYGGVLV